MMAPAQRDLVVLVADRDMKATLEGILRAPDRLGIRSIASDVFPHPEHDPGCLLHAGDFLDVHRETYSHALVVFDHEGCGREGSTRDELEAEVTGQLSGRGWRDRAAVVVVAPEVDSWAWSDSPHVADALGWKGRSAELRDWLVRQGFLAQAAGKPARPKEALEAALRQAKRPRSSAVYGTIMSRVSFDRCTDAAFGKLKKVLGSWFGLPNRGREEG